MHTQVSHAQVDGGGRGNERPSGTAAHLPMGSGRCTSWGGGGTGRAKTDWRLNLKLVTCRPNRTQPRTLFGLQFATPAPSKVTVTLSNASFWIRENAHDVP